MIYITLTIYADAKKKEKIQTSRFDDKLEACPTCRARILLAYSSIELSFWVSLYQDTICVPKLIKKRFKPDGLMTGWKHVLHVRHASLLAYAFTLRMVFDLRNGGL